MKFLYSSASAVCLLLASNLSHGDTLLEIYQLALENDPQLAADRAALQAGLQAKDIGLANLLPQILGSASYTEDESDSEGESVLVLPPPVGITETPTDQQADGDTTIYSVSLQQPLFDLQAWYAYKQGGVQSKAALSQFQANQQAFILRVAGTYFNVLRAIQTLETALAELAALESQLEQTRQRYEVGLTAITDVHEVRARYDNAIATVTEARGNLAIAYEALEVLTAREHDTIAPISDEFPVADPVPAERSEWVAFALKNNHTLRTAQLQADIAELTAKIRRSAYLPRLNLLLSHRRTDFSSEGTEFAVTPNEDFTSIRDADDTSIGVDLSIPIYTGGRISAERRQAVFQAVEAEDLLVLTRRETIQTTRSAHLAVETGVARVAALRQAIISSQSALEATRAGYEVGTRTLVDVLIAQQNLYGAERDYYSALYDYVIDTLRLKRAAGLLNTEDIVELNAWLNAEDQVSRSDYVQ